MRIMVVSKPHATFKQNNAEEEAGLKAHSTLKFVLVCDLYTPRLISYRLFACVLIHWTCYAQAHQRTVKRLHQAEFTLISSKRIGLWHNSLQMAIDTAARATAMMQMLCVASNFALTCKNARQQLLLLILSLDSCSRCDIGFSAMLILRLRSAASQTIETSLFQDAIDMSMACSLQSRFAFVV